MRLDVPLEDVSFVVLVEANAALLHHPRRRRWLWDRRCLLLERAHVDQLRRPPDRPHHRPLRRLTARGFPRVARSEIAK